MIMRHTSAGHGHPKFAGGRNHINGIENFWNQARQRIRTFNGIPKLHVNLFLKECE